VPCRARLHDHREQRLIDPPTAFQRDGKNDLACNLGGFEYSVRANGVVSPTITRWSYRARREAA